MINSVRITLLFAGALLALTGAAAGQEQATGVGIERLFAEYLQQIRDEALDQDPKLKAVPRTDKAEATVVGTVLLVEEADIFPDGTPFRLVVVRSRKPIPQVVYVVCPGPALINSCGRLGIGRRAAFTSDILVIPDGESAGLALLIVKRLQT